MIGFGFLGQLPGRDRGVAFANEQAFRGVQERLLGRLAGSREPDALSDQGRIS
jgi:hypothetical protein